MMSSLLFLGVYLPPPEEGKNLTHNPEHGADTPGQLRSADPQEASEFPCEREPGSKLVTSV